MKSVAPARHFPGSDIGWHLSEAYLERQRRRGGWARAAEATPAQVIKIKEIVARVEDLAVAPLPDQAIVQGVIVEQVFFVGPDQIVRERVVRTPFSHRIGVPGLDPERLGRGEQVLDVTADVAFVIAHLIDASRVKDKIVVSLGWTLTEKRAAGGFLLDAVVASGQEQVLVVAIKEFPVAVVSVVEVPGFAVVRQQLLLVERKPLEAIKVKRVEARVRDVSVQVLDGRALGSGVVVKQVQYVGPDGIVRGLEEELPFSEVKALPGVPAGTIPTASAEVEFVLTELDAARRLLTQKIVLRLQLAVPAAPVTVVSEVTGPGIVTRRVLILVDGREVYVVTDVSGPGIKDVVKQTILAQVVGRPAPEPLVVVVDLKVDP